MQLYKYKYNGESFCYTLDVVEGCKPIEDKSETKQCAVVQDIIIFYLSKLYFYDL